MKFTAYSLVAVIAAASTVVSARTPLLRGQRALNGVPSAETLQAEINALQGELNELESMEKNPVIMEDMSGPDSDEESESNSISIDSYSDSSEEESQGTPVVVADMSDGKDSNSTSLDSDEESDSNSTSIDSYSDEESDGNSTSIDSYSDESEESTSVDEATNQYNSEMENNEDGNDYGFEIDLDPEFYGTDLVHYHEPDVEDTPQTPDDNSELPVLGSDRRYLVTAEELQVEIEHVQAELNELEAAEELQVEIEHVQAELNELEAVEENTGEGEDLDEATDLYNSEMESEAASGGGGDPFGMDMDPEYMGGDFENYKEPELEDTPVTPKDGSELAVLDPDMN